MTHFRSVSHVKAASKSHTPQVAAIDSSTVFIAGHTGGFVIRMMGIDMAFQW